MTLYDVSSEKLASFLDAQKGEKPSMFLASDVIKRHFGAYTESQESSSLPVAKHFLGLCLAKRHLLSLIMVPFLVKSYFPLVANDKNFFLYNSHPVHKENN